MSAPSAIGESRSYPAQLFTLVGRSGRQLIRSPTAPHRAEATRRLRGQALWLLAVGAVLVVALMFGFDATEIGLMPPRGAPGAWPARAITDFGKDSYVLMTLAAVLIVMALAFPLLGGASRHRLLRITGHVEYLFFAVALPVFSTEIIKYIVGRGRPFVGGRANPFNFAPFAGTEAYFSFPSAHAVTAFALALGVASIWPRWRIPMFIYAVAIAASRLMLLAHHPSDVVGGAVLGFVGALAMRNWFAAREIGFAIDENGKIVPR
ncbi:MAG: phosphatase PAP2 family protein [Bradyrhizobium sp.]|nr:phosphatase PAP2 family protein [Bradyrhizobium sp.]